MSEILQPCPFCGEPVEFNKFAEKVVCEDCGATIYSDYWNTRPIEDALNARIAELEGKIDQLTAHDATERQDDKLPEREVCEACGGDGSILLRDNYKGQATATVDCPYCNCTGYVKECE